MKSSMILLTEQKILNAAFFYAGLGSLDYDVIGLSYYPIWHGKNPDDLQAAITNLGNQFNKDVVIAETAYPFTLGWSDYTNNVIGLADQILPQFPATEQGQLDFLLKLKTIVTANTPWKRHCLLGRRICNL